MAENKVYGVVVGEERATYKVDGLWSFCKAEANKWATPKVKKDDKK